VCVDFCVISGGSYLGIFFVNTTENRFLFFILIWNAFIDLKNKIKFPVLIQAHTQLHPRVGPYSSTGPHGLGL
jgi:hypothetical protein